MTGEELEFWAAASVCIGPMLHEEIAESEGVASPEELLAALARAFVVFSVAYQQETGVEVDVDIKVTGLQ